ncbi:hypothetical protein INR49_024827 [Caranx melampygus]|nr:hypothetical protein INR49_024827 [Caranx melampygus]
MSKDEVPWSSSHFQDHLLWPFPLSLASWPVIKQLNEYGWLWHFSFQCPISTSSSSSPAPAAAPRSRSALS